MNEKPITSWSEITLTDLFYAFRKAKVDCYYETSVRVAEAFIEYEQNLSGNLAELLQKIQTGQCESILLVKNEQAAIFPKQLVFGKNDPNKKAGHSFFSDAARNTRSFEDEDASPEFRIIGDFSVEVHVLSALWVNLIGHKFDAALSDTALASRLRRYRTNMVQGIRGKYHVEAIGSFEPYYTPYKHWRDGGLNAIEEALRNDLSVAALTLDVSNFYHSIDCSFAADTEFHQSLGFELSDFESDFTKSFVHFLNRWAELCANKIQEFGGSEQTVGGLPIGLSIVRILANSVLDVLDRAVENSILPIYYARYVDDIFLVIKDTGKFSSQEDLWRFILARIPMLKQREGSDSVEIDLPKWGGKTVLKFHTQKQKCFFLKGRSGLDLIDNISSQIREISSERRLMPLPEDLEQGQAARALTASGGLDEADSLRRADGLTLRRLGWSVLLRSVEVLARDLRPADWSEERHKFYDFAHEHVIRADRILGHIDRLPRLFAITVALADWPAAKRIYSETISAIYALETLATGKARVNGEVCEPANAEMWNETRSRVDSYFREALIRAYPTEQGVPKARAFETMLDQIGIQAVELSRLALLSREADWSRLPYKEHIRLHADRHAPLKPEEDSLSALYTHHEMLRRFLNSSIGKHGAREPSRLSVDISESPFDSFFPFLFPTRAYTPEEIALYLPTECVAGDPIVAAHTWAEYTRAVRGVWVRSELAEKSVLPARAPSEKQENSQSVEGTDGPKWPIDSDYVKIQGSNRNFPIKVGITNFKTSDQTWAQSASGVSDITPARYRAIAGLINQALREPESPDYIVFPELSLPAAWIPTISGRLREGGISLIGGLDYTHLPDGTIESSAVLVLDDHRLGYPTSLQLRQRKSEPAPGEDENLHVSHGKRWNKPRTELKPVYSHNDFHFSVLVCSELQNIVYRNDLQGKIDCLFIVSWNKDIETFAALVDSASLDVHSYVALSNNRAYGDSRVRRPAKKSFERDLCRVRGGINDQLVIVEIDPRMLRAQQSRATRWPKKTDQYKPAPEGFLITGKRKTIPS
ncbi:hypothetical protein HKD42_06025 [Altererythrobacter sp. RZ02]|uniref:Reverse transcriptase (RNA-dependent DNA polymerase) n=1 Tax=Pontixanthobacter rizhaonensis TaxID=2730337 RepID=A0A848QG76_9SPHN|nr:hypothetical protein [Pontixanthobacter rizhaonensis]NMW31612.1 hypothetical protein [Pontixanthobacter rizhaonensis]